MSILINWLISAVAIIVTAYILPGVVISSFSSALVAALVLGLLNAFVRPILLFLTLPINILTLGLFTFVINALVILLASDLVPGFKVDGFLTALIFSIVLSLINYVLFSLA